MTSVLEFLFGSWKTPAAQAKEYRRAIDRSVRSLDRERDKLIAQEQRVMAEVRFLGKRGQVSAARASAKQIITIRSAINSFYELKTRMLNVSLKMQTLGTSHELMTAMQNLNKMIMQINRKYDLPQVKKLAEDFMKQTDTLEIKEDMIDDTIDGIMPSDVEGEDEETIVNQIMDEIMLVEDVNVVKGDFPTKKTAVRNK